MLGDHRELQAGGDEAVAQRRPGRSAASPRRVCGALPVSSSQRRLQAREVVGGALALAAARPGDDGAVARAHELLELGLGLLQRARAEVGGLGAELERLVRGQRREPDARARVERARRSASGLDVEVVRVVVVERRADVLPVVAQRRLDLLLGGDEDRRRPADQVEQRVEAVDRQQLGDVGPLVLAGDRGDLGQLAVLGGELGRGRDLDRVGRRRASAG